MDEYAPGGCQCYPASRGYPRSMAKGCSGTHACWVLKELKEGQTPEGRAAYRARYFAELQKARDAAAEVPSGEGVRYQLVKLGVPANAVAVACRADPTQALDGAKLWWKMDHKLCPALVLTSPTPGTGKTVAAAWVGIEWARRWPWNQMPGGGKQTDPLVWLDGPRLSSLTRHDEQAADLLAAAAVCRLLVVDDAGREGNRPAVEALSDVLMERIDRKRLTVLTTNQRGEQFRTRYGEPLADRLRSAAFIVDIKGMQSMRKLTAVRGGA